MVKTNLILADVCVGVSELKKNPISVVAQGDGGPVAVMNRSKPAFYAVPSETFELMMEKLDDYELAQLVKERKNQEEIEVSLDDL